MTRSYSMHSLNKVNAQPICEGFDARFMRVKV